MGKSIPKRPALFVAPSSQMSSKSKRFQLTLVLIITLIGMTLFESTKHLLFPGISIWQSLTVTIILSSIIATSGAAIVLRQQDSILISLKRRVQAHTTDLVQSDQIFEREEFVQTILNSTNSHIAVLDQQGKIVAVNKAWENFTHENGGKEGTLTSVGADYLAVCRTAGGPSSEGAAEALTGLQRVLDGSLEQFEQEYACHSPTERRWFVMRVTPLASSGRGVVVSHYNITQRMRVEETLRESEAKYRSLVDEVSDGIYVSDLHGRLLFANRALARILGFEQPDSLIGRTFLEFVPNEKASELAEKYRLAMTTGTDSKIVSTEIVRADGIIGSIEIKPQLIIEGGKPIGNRGTVHDVTERRQTEINLKKFELGIERSNEAVFLTEPDGKITYVNPAFEKIYGYSKAEVLGKTPRIIKSGAVERTVYEDFWKMLLSKQVVAGEIINRTKDGRSLNIESTSNPIIGERGELLGFIAIQRDVTERRQAEAKLRESEFFFKETQQAASIGSYKTDFIKGFWESSTVLDHIFGIDKDYGKSIQGWLDLVYPDDREMMDRYLKEEVISKHKPFNKEYRIIRPVDGEIRWVAGLGKVDFDVEGNLVSMAGTIRDITERKQTEDILLDSENRFGSFVEHTSEWIFMTDEQGIVVEWNPGAEQITGLGREAVIGKPLWDVQYQLVSTEHKTDAMYGRLKSTLMQVLHTGSAPILDRIIETQFRRRDGIVRVAEQRLFPIHTAKGIRLSGISRDITERKRAEEEILKRSQHLEALRQISLELAVELNLKPLLQSITQHAIPLIKAATCSCYLLNKDRDELERVILGGGADLPMNSRTRKRGEGLIGQVWETGAAIVANDYEKWVGHRDLYKDLPPRAVMGVPIRSGDKFLGVMNVTAEHPHSFSQSDVELLSLFADQAAIAIQNARLFEETRARAEQLSTLNEIGKAVSERLEVANVLKVIHEQAQHILHCDVFFVSLYNAKTNALYFPLIFDGEERYEKVAEELIEDTGIYRVIKSGEPLLVNRTSEDMQMPFDPKRSIGNKSRRAASLMFAPLKYGTRLMGVMSIQSYTPAAYAEEDLLLLSGIANQTAVAFENARLFEETERNLLRMQALHQIDKAISGNFDRQTILETFLSHLTAQLSVDAADILVFNPHTQTLEYVAGLGFKTQALRHTHLRLGNGLAGKAALSRKTLAIKNLGDEIDGLARSPLILNEGFVNYYGVPLIIKGQVKGVLEVFHRQPLDANPEWLDFLDTLAGQGAIALDNVSLFEEVQQANTELILAYDATIEGWSHALDLRDKETEGHTQRVAELSSRLARQMSMSDADLAQLRRGALLHDIGKMGVPDSILLKPGPLTDEEWRVMRMHPVFAYELLAPISYLRPALDIPYCHHEKWDGTGYPRGLKGEQIPLVGRLFAVVDVWDALRSNRPYRKAWGKEKTLAHIQSLSGTHFDPRVVEEFMKMMKFEGEKL